VIAATLSILLTELLWPLAARVEQSFAPYLVSSEKAMVSL